LARRLLSAHETAECRGRVRRVAVETERDATKDKLDSFGSAFGRVRKRVRPGQVLRDRVQRTGPDDAFGPSRGPAVGTAGDDDVEPVPRGERTLGGAHRRPSADTRRAGPLGIPAGLSGTPVPQTGRPAACVW